MKVLNQRSGRNNRLAAVLAAGLLGGSAYGADTLWYRTLGVEDGLSQNFVTAIAQDRDGFMWFGTAGGLNRWDGHEFGSYVPERDKESSLSDSVILALHAGRDGRLWVGTQRGLDCFDPATKSFRRYGALFHKPGSAEPLAVEGISSDQAGRTWFASFSTPLLCRLDPRSGEGTAHMIAGASNYWVAALHIDQADRLWVAMQSGGAGSPRADRLPVFVFDNASDLGDGPLPIPRNPLSLDLKGGRVVGILEDNAHRLWFGRDGGGAFRFDPQNGAVSQVDADPAHSNALADGKVRSMGVDPAGNIWFLTRSASSELSTMPDRLYRVDPETLAARRFDAKRAALLPGDEARMERLAIDRSAVLWLGSNGGGLRHADVGVGGFSLYGKGFAGSPGLNISFVRAICESRDGNLWVGTPLGLDRIDRSRGEPTYSNPSADGSLKLPHPNVQAICEDHEGNLWIGTAGGVAVLEKLSGQVRYYRHDETQPRSIADDYVLTIHKDADERLWFGTLGKGLDEFDHQTRSFRHYPDNYADPTRLPSGTVLALYTDSRQRLWIGTGAGLGKIESPSASERSLQRIAFESGALKDIGILSICESPSAPDVLWLGTQQDGLCRLDVRTEKCRFYTTQNSDLPNNTVYGVLADRRGRLWLSSNRGLACYDPERDTFRNYDSQDGLQSTEFNGRAFFKSTRGEMFFGGVKGLNSFFPDEIKDNQNPPRVCLSEVRASERGARKPDAAATVIYRRGTAHQEVEVPFRLRDIAFDFVALHFSAPQRNRCQFKLEPYDQDWHSPTAQRQARYTNLDPGRYTFRVKAISSHGVGSAGEVTFSFVVLPPFYATGWFRGLTAFGILASLAGVHRWRTHTLRRRQALLESQVAERTEELRTAFETLEKQALKLKELDAAKSKFFANISHEFRTPIMLTLTPLRDLQSGMHGPIREDARGEVEMAIRNANRLLELVDQLLMLARLDAGQLEFRPREMRLDDFLRRAAARYESLAKREKISFRCDFPDAAVRGTFDENELDQIISNLLGNAFKFTPSGGSVTLRLGVAPDGWATIQVEDTGPGIPAQDLPRIFERFYRGEQENGSLPGTGLGLAVAKECVQLHGGELSAENRPEGGTRFIVRLPLGPAASPSPPTPSGLPGEGTQPSPNVARPKGESSHEP
jgi:signal transduction histidine kinase/ligand-binding sensor domain-containing protein